MSGGTMSRRSKRASTHATYVQVQDSEPGQHQGQPVRFLKRVHIHEVSPVLVGAQTLTRTDPIKDDAPVVLDPAMARLKANWLRDEIMRLTVEERGSPC